MEKYTVNSFKDYINHIEKKCVGKGRFVLRGQLSGDKLIPKFFRAKTDIQDKNIETEIAMLGLRTALLRRRWSRYCRSS
jgi:predicted YcjX-like family ATPase